MIQKTFLLIFLIILIIPLVVQAEVSGCSGSTCKLGNPLGDEVTPQTLIGKVINAALGIVGSLALVMFIYGGFTWMLAAGNAEAVKKGKDIIIWATIGLVVIFSAYALVKFVITGITNPE